jgi:hypothetical protein
MRSEAARETTSRRVSGVANRARASGGWLIVCSSDDMSALWTYEGLKRRGVRPVELVTADMLAYSLESEHRLTPDAVEVSISLADGRRVSSSHAAGVLNRLTSIPLAHMRQAEPRDQDYAVQELNAYFLSWLHSLPCPVLNRPTPQGLAGRWRHASEWVWLAIQAGLPSPSYRQTSRDQIDETITERGLLPPGTPTTTVLVVNGQVVGAAVPPGIASGCGRLAALCGTPLLGVDLADGAAGPWTFAGATPLPDLRRGGDALLDALASAMGEA